jgi:uncharacterized protein YndB with AHSA1/START domain
VTRWLGSEATLEPDSGGLYRVAVLPGTVASGTFVEVDPPRRLVFTFGWEPGAAGGHSAVMPPGSTTVEIELEAADGGTLLRFAHRELPSPDVVPDHERGWETLLERLAIVASGGDVPSEISRGT